LDEVEEIISEFRKLIISLYFVHPDSDDIAAKKRIIDTLLDLIKDELVDSFSYEEGTLILKNYIVDKVEELFG
jgi:hypothetical protein